MQDLETGSEYRNLIKEDRCMISDEDGIGTTMMVEGLGP
jgi:hypothetical protein